MYLSNKKLIEGIMNAFARVFKSATRTLKNKLKGKNRCDPDVSEITEDVGKAMGWGMWGAIQGALRWPGIEAGYGKKGKSGCG